VVFGASFDSPDENRAFAEKFAFQFPLLTVDGVTAQAYGAADAGQTSGYAKRVGVVIAPDGAIKEWLPKVDAKTYPQDVLKRL